MAINLEKAIPFRLRSNPLKLGPNFKNISPQIRSKIEGLLAKQAARLNDLEQNGYKIPPSPEEKKLKETLESASALLSIFKDLPGKKQYFAKKLSWLESQKKALEDADDPITSGLSRDLAMYCWHFNADVPRALELILKNKNGGILHVLDVGCGLAAAAREMQENLAEKGRVWGVDLIKYNQKNVRPDLPQIPLLSGAMESLPFIGRNLFDVVFITNLECSLAPLATLDELMRVLSPGGVACFRISLSSFDDPSQSFFGKLAEALNALSHKQDEAAKNPSKPGPLRIWSYKDPKCGIDSPYFLAKLVDRMRGDFFTNHALKHRIPLYPPEINSPD